MIKANKFKSHACLILGDEEWKEKKIIWKNFTNGTQKILPLNELNEFLKKI